jgi:aldehyde:ferredoxin oxidoreductase
MLSYKSCQEFLTAVTGEEFTFEDILIIGNRISLLRHAFNAREGLKFTVRQIPQRLLGGVKTGPLAGVELNKEQLMEGYLKVSGLDPVTLAPTKESLLAAGLDFVVCT